MYSNEKKNGFSVLDILVKIIFAGLFIFILVWLFQKKVPNMTPFYSNVFRENIKYMQEAGESYFTDEKMPTEVGQEVKLSLSDMIDKKLILPFVDEDGKACNLYDSYISATKNESGYSLKTNLVCDKESDYTIKVLGCHNYCEGNNCNKTCVAEKITQYQFKKLNTTTSTKYKCPSGYTSKNGYCYKTVLSDTKPATQVVSNTKVDVVPAKVVVNPANKVPVSVIETTTAASTTTKTVAYNCTKYKVETQYTTVTKNEAYDCPKQKVENQCVTTTTTQSYNCNCTTSFSSTGKLITTCNTCYNSVPVKKCSDVTVSYTGTCYRQVQSEVGKDVTVPYTGTCYKEETTTIPASTTYSCPKGSTEEGSGSNLKCYNITSGSTTYECEDNSYTLSGTKCTKPINSPTTTYNCNKYSGYKLSGTSCKKYTTKKVKATPVKTTSKYYSYKWSDSETLSGWTFTGKTKTTEGKLVCE